MALAAARARVLRALSRRWPAGGLPVGARRCCNEAGDPAALPPGGYGVWRERAARDPAGFWAEVARGSLSWDSPFHTACEAGPAAGAAAATRWFLGGRLNVSGKASPGPAHPPTASGRGGHGAPRPVLPAGGTRDGGEVSHWG